MKIRSLGQSGFLITLPGGPVILIDPWLSPSPFRNYTPSLAVRDISRCDLILVSHAHLDHFDYSLMRKLKLRTPVFIGSRRAAAAAARAGLSNPISANAGRGIDIPNINITVRCVSTDHPFAPDAVGFIIEADKTIYFSGDTRFNDKLVAELVGFSIDVALLQISCSTIFGFKDGMDIEDAARLAEQSKPATVIPMHYHDILRHPDPERFRKRLQSSGIRVEIIAPGQEVAFPGKSRAAKTTAKPKSRKIKIPWGKTDNIEFELPQGWNLLGEMRPSTPTPLNDIDAELEKVLGAPTASPPLADMARGKKNIVIVVDDISRPTPAHLLMGRILDHLDANATSSQDITVIPGLGMHRPMTGVEMERKIGPENFSRVKWQNHDCRDLRQLTLLGKTRKGTRVLINSAVAAADLVVVVGTIEPHVHAGFGGGYKNILPGVAGVETIGRNHAICAHPEYFSLIGTRPENNPMRLDIEEAGAMLPGSKFLVNTVLDSDGGIARLVAGCPVAAHRAGVSAAGDIYGVKIPAQADVVITDSFPMDIDIRQAVKCVANTLFAAKPGGVIIAVFRCEEGMGGVKAPDIKLHIPLEAMRLLAKVLSLAVMHFAPPGISSEERFAAYFMLQALQRNRLFIYAPTVAEEIGGIIPGVTVFSDLNEALRAAHRIRPEASVLVFPKGGFTFPAIG